MKESLIKSIINIIIESEYSNKSQYSDTHGSVGARLKEDLSNLPTKTFWDLSQTIHNLKHKLDYIDK